MWWDLICGEFWAFHIPTPETPPDFRSLDSEGMATLDVLFQTLTRILALDDPRTRSYALHGLGHLHHPGVPKTVQRYIDKHGGDWTPEDLKWVEQCRDGTVL
ncbi:MAG: hypothetical protein ACREAC_19550, partial [Blastocatellia bacterium]